MSGAVERTLFMIKPDAVSRGLVGAILSRVEESGFKMLSMRMVHLDAATARGFYHVHEGKPFLDSLVSFMSSGPVVVVALEHDGAIAKLREIVGATDPAEAAPGTIRADFALDKEKNSVHASDAVETAKWEIAFFVEHGVLSPPEA
jgi:nucleoside-diphosphate kinase